MELLIILIIIPIVQLLWQDTVPPALVLIYQINLVKKKKVWYNKNMEKELRTNAVKMSPEEQYQIRKSIIRLFKQGKKNGEIAKILDVSERHVRVSQETIL